MADSNGKNVAILGGGIGALATAYYALQRDPDLNIDIYAPLMGGKIKSEKTSGNSWADRGPEFFDLSQKNSLQMCKELGVELVSTHFDDAKEFFVLPNGKSVDSETFYNAVEPLQKLIIADKEIIAAEPYGERAKHLDSLSLEQYMQELANSLPATEKVDPAYVKALAATYTSECGNDTRDTSALQFVRESSSELGVLVESDCGLRVKGGTEVLIKALQTRLEEKGVKFHDGATATKINKTGDHSFDITFADGKSEHADNVVLAMSAPALGKVKGLESLGFTADEIDLLNNTQYTHSAKFTVKLKPGVDQENACVFSNDGWQSWPGPGKDNVTFLVGGKDFNSKLKGRALIEECAEKYSQALGKQAADLFDTKQVVFGGPDVNVPCYCSPKQKQALKLSMLSEKAAELADNGVGLVGSFLPQQPNGGVGFMDASVMTAEVAAAGITAARGKSQDKAIDKLPSAHRDEIADLEALFKMNVSPETLLQVQANERKAAQANMDHDGMFTMRPNTRVTGVTSEGKDLVKAQQPQKEDKAVGKGTLLTK